MKCYTGWGSKTYTITKTVQTIFFLNKILKLLGAQIGTKLKAKKKVKFF